MTGRRVGGHFTGARHLRTGGLAVLAVGLLALTAPAASGVNPAHLPNLPQTRPGNPVPTRGPLSEHPDVIGRTQLDVVNGLLNGDPIYNGDYQDPEVLRTPDALYLYATNTRQDHIPVMEMTAQTNFSAQLLGDALPRLPSWTAPGFQWAPAIWQRPDGTYRLYYATAEPPAPPVTQCLHELPPSASDKDKQFCGLEQGATYRAQCISVASSDNPAGPFVDRSTGPMICPQPEGAIDPSVFVSQSGTPWLLWKSDGDGIKPPERTVIYSQQLSADGLSVKGPAYPLITNDQPWEGPVVESTGDGAERFELLALLLRQLVHDRGLCHRRGQVPVDCRTLLQASGSSVGVVG